MNAKRCCSSLLAAAVAALVVLVLSGTASACPTCKDTLAHDPAAANLARGIYYSILFMISMPFLIFGGISAYFYWEICKAKARLAQADSGPAPSSAETCPTLL